MRKIILVFLCAATMNSFAQSENHEKVTPQLRNLKDSLNYFLGLNLGFSVGAAPWKLDAGLIAEGILSVVEGNTPYDRQTCKDIFEELHIALNQKLEEFEKPKEPDNLERGLAFLAENGKREEVKTTDSGLQYEVITLGEGPLPADSSIVKIQYEGALIDGTVFDSSFERGKTNYVDLKRVIRGWREGLQLMPVGSVYRFYIPPDLGYGDRARGPIPANSVLIFRIELLGVESSETFKGH